MITAKFLGDAHGLTKVTVSGHAGYADSGEDIVCAAVTSAVQFTANGITEILGVSADVQVQGDTISIALPPNPPAAAVSFLQALKLHLELLSQEYEGTIQPIIQVDPHAGNAD